MNDTTSANKRGLEPDTETGEPMSAEDLIRNLMQDLILGNSAEQLATEVLEEFVFLERPESPKVIAMLDAPTETLLEVLKGVVVQANQQQLEALRSHGYQFIENLKYEVKRQMEAATIELEAVKTVH